MPKRPIPPPLPVEINQSCTLGCSLNPRKLPIADIVTGWFSAGYNNEMILSRAAAAGFRLSDGAIGRHRKLHLTLVPDGGTARLDDGSAYSDEKVDHIKVLEAIIARGARSISTWRVGPDMTIKAMDMWYRLTQGNAQQAWMDEMAAAIASADVQEARAAAGEGGHAAADVDAAAARVAEEQLEPVDGAA